MLWRFVRILGFALPFVGSASAAPAPVRLPGPSEAGHPRGASEKHVHPSEACGECHAAIVSEWADSLHGKAWTDPLFQSAYRLEHLAFCRRCHAPEADPAREPPLLDAEVGVGCAACHTQGGNIVNPVRFSDSPHETVVDNRWQGSGACAGCHQFLFPSISRQVIPIAMQNTAVEWSLSSAHIRSCASCHMRVVTGPDGKRHREHRFHVRDRVLMSSVVTVSAAVSGDSLRLLIENRGVGHAFPTGDVFRRLLVRAFTIVDGLHEEPLPQPKALERRFLDVPVNPHATVPSLLQRVQVEDTRLGPAGTPSATREVTLAIPESHRARPIRWQLVYQRMSPRLAGYFGIDLSEEELVLAEGRVLPETERP